jgi:DNA-directed RNA polymerase subunit RPC12/RpoP
MCEQAQMVAQTKRPPFLIAAPRCPKCGAQTILVRVFPDRLGDQRLYECAKCEHEVIEAGQFKRTAAPFRVRNVSRLLG